MICHKNQINNQPDKQTNRIWCNILTFDLAVNQGIGASSRRHQDIALTCGRVEFSADATQVGVKQLYNPVPQTVPVSWSQLQLKFKLLFEAVRTSSQQRAWALRTPSWAAQQNEKEVLLKTEELGGQYVAICSVSNSPLTHNPFATLSNKVWEIYFYKEACSFVNWSHHYVSTDICMYMSMWLYNIDIK